MFGRVLNAPLPTTPILMKVFSVYVQAELIIFLFLTYGDLMSPYDYNQIFLVQRRILYFL